MKSEGETQSSGICPDVTLRPRSVQNVSPITLPLSTIQAGVWPQVFPHSSSHVAALYMALSVCVCVCAILQSLHVFLGRPTGTLYQICYLNLSQ